MEEINKKHRVIRLDDLICDGYLCKTHTGTTWIFKDKGHLSHMGSAALGKMHDFFKIIVGDEQHFNLSNEMVKPHAITSNLSSKVKSQ